MQTLRYSALAVLVVLVGLVGIGCGGQPSAESVVPRVAGAQIAEILDDPDVFLLDVRLPGELVGQGAIEGYTLIPIDELADRLDELPRDRPILTL